MEDEGSVVLQNKPGVPPPVRIPPPNSYVPSSAYPPYSQMYPNEYGAYNELRQRNLGSMSEPPATPLLNSPVESFGVYIKHVFVA